jgi:hypothetical protein
VPVLWHHVQCIIVCVSALHGGRCATPTELREHLLAAITPILRQVTGDIGGEITAKPGRKQEQWGSLSEKGNCHTSHGERQYCHQEHICIQYAPMFVHMQSLVLQI